MDKYKNGYDITSFHEKALDGGVNGSLRKSDIVDVYTLLELLDDASIFLRLRKN